MSNVPASALLLHKPKLVIPCRAVMGGEENSWLRRIERIIECEDPIECSGDFGPSHDTASLAGNVSELAAAEVLPESHHGPPQRWFGMRHAREIVLNVMGSPDECRRWRHSVRVQFLSYYGIDTAFES